MQESLLLILSERRGNEVETHNVDDNFDLFNEASAIITFSVCEF
jgi:hypothetical protein